MALPINAGTIIDIAQMGALALAGYEGYIWYTGEESMIPNDPIIVWLRSLKLPTGTPPPQQCATGYHLSNGVCVLDTAPPPVTCNPGYHLENGSCIVNVSTCPTGFSLVNGVCVQNPPPVTCPAGYHLANGVCIQDTPNTCQAGYHTDPVTGLCVIDVTPPPPVNDLVKPTVDISSPSSGFLTLGPTVTVRGVADDDVALAQVLMSVDAGVYQAVHPDVGNYAQWSMIVPLTVVGAHTITVKAIDTAGNAQYDTIQVTLLPPGSPPPPVQPTCENGQKINTVTNLCEAIINLDKPSYITGELAVIRATGFQGGLVAGETVECKLIINGVTTQVVNAGSRTDGSLTKSIPVTVVGSGYVLLTGLTSAIVGRANLTVTQGTVVTCPAGQHLANGVCVVDTVPTPQPGTAVINAPAPNASVAIGSNLAVSVTPNASLAPVASVMVSLDANAPIAAQGQTGGTWAITLVNMQGTVGAHTLKVAITWSGTLVLPINITQTINFTAAAIPTMALDKTAYVQNENIVVTGANFAPSGVIYLSHTVGGALVQGMNITVGANGTFTRTFVATTIGGGHITAYVTSGGAQIAQSPGFNVTAPVAPSLASNKPTYATGEAIVITGVGFVPGTAYQLRYTVGGVLDTAVNVTASAAGTFTGNFVANGGGHVTVSGTTIQVNITMGTGLAYARMQARYGRSTGNAMIARTYVGQQYYQRRADTNQRQYRQEMRISI